MQVKLLRVLQEREIVRVGGSESVSIDVRIIAATKIDLRRQVEKGHFRDDLFYRLNILPLHIPPLRERKEDIPVLADHFFQKYAVPGKTNAPSEELLSLFMAHDWPGNVRELENIVQRVIALSRTGMMDIAALGLVRPPPGEITTMVPSGEYPPYEEFMLQKEKEIVGWALQKSGQNVSEAARRLRLPRTTLTSRIPKLFPSMAKSEGSDSRQDT